MKAKFLVLDFMKFGFYEIHAPKQGVMIPVAIFPPVGRSDRSD
jgi:hypothetical protein